MDGEAKRVVRPTKVEINEMPLFCGLGLPEIVLVDNLTALNDAKMHLSTCPVLGFDTESQPTYKPGQKSKGPHLIQFSTLERAFLFPVEYKAGLSLALSIISNSDVLKVGFGLAGDRSLFRKQFDASVNNAKDLAGKLSHQFRIKQNVGARAAIAIIFGQRLSKSS